MELLNTPEDLMWLFTTHLRRYDKYHQQAYSFTLEGNEDFPQRVTLYTTTEPRLDEQPLAVFVYDDEATDELQQRWPLEVGYPYTDGETIGVYTKNCKLSESGRAVTLVVSYMDEQPVYEAFPIATLHRAE